MTRHRYLPWNWFADWSWAERFIVLIAWLAPIGILAIQGRGALWLAGAFALLALAVLHLMVWLHGGWGLLGPHFYYDVVRLARRGRSTVARVIYLFAMLVGLSLVYAHMPYRQVWSPNYFAHVSEQFTYSLFLVQNLAILILSPAYVGSAVAEERERRTLEMLQATQLSATEIVLGKLFSRIIHLGGFVLAGLPILAIVQFWGGVDMLLVGGNLVNTLLNIVTIGSLCLLISTMLTTVTRAVLTSYAVVLLIGATFLFPLQDARTGGGTFTVQHLGWIAIVHATITAVCLAGAVLVLRDRGPMPLRPQYRPARRPLNRSWNETAQRSATTARSSSTPAPIEPSLRRPERERIRADILDIPYTLPPIGENCLLWKECYLGGPALAFSPVLLVPMIPFVALGMLLLGMEYYRAWFLDTEGHRQAIQSWFTALLFFYYLFLALYALGVAFRATASVTRERQQQTLEPLLLLPIDRAEILRAKWLGGLCRGWPWLALLVADLILGTLVGAYHPASALLLCLAPWPIVFFLQSLGLLLSVVVPTVVRANLIMVMVIVLFIASMIFGFGDSTFLAYPNTFAFSWWDRGDHLTNLRLLWAAVLIPVYLFCAWGYWRIARFRFEQTSA